MSQILDPDNPPINTQNIRNIPLKNHAKNYYMSIVPEKFHESY